MTTTCILKNAHVMPECDLKDHAMLPLVLSDCRKLQTRQNSHRTTILEGEITIQVIETGTDAFIISGDALVICIPHGGQILWTSMKCSMSFKFLQRMHAYSTNY